VHTRSGSWTAIALGVIVAAAMAPHALRLFYSDDYVREYLLYVVLLTIFGGGIGLVLGGIVNLVRLRRRRNN
jgi:hypothetical protein